MMRTRYPGRLACGTALAAVATAFCSAPAFAQQQAVPPEFYTLDDRGVDLVSGQLVRSAVDVVIGDPDNGGIAHGRVLVGTVWRDTLAGTVSISGISYSVSVGSESEVFTKSGSTFTPVSNNGSTLTETSTEFTFTTSNGTVIRLLKIAANATTAYAGSDALVSSVTEPNGQITTWHWSVTNYCAVYDRPTLCVDFRDAIRLQAVNNNRGYQVNFKYESDAVPNAPNLPNLGWLRRTAAGGINLADQYCPPAAAICTGTEITWPRVDYVSTNSYGTQISSVTDQSAHTTTYSYALGGLTGIRLPEDTSDILTVAYTSNRVASLTDTTGAWTYGYVDSGSTRTTTATGPAMGTLTPKTIVVANLTTGRATSITNALGQTVSYLYDGQRRVTRVTQPEGNYVKLDYDARGNVTTTTTVEKPGTPDLPDIVTSATFPSTCADPRTCNQPTTTTDARSAVTNYSYAAHGGVETITSPPPTTGVGVIRPEVRIDYASRYAWYQNSAGTVVQAPTPIILPIQSSACATGAAPACVGTATETRQTVTYGTTGANNLLPTAVTVAAGNGSPSATTAMTYTPIGDVATVDGPIANDVTTYRYDTSRQVVDVIGPDPDSTGPMLHRATHTAYDAAGRVTQVDSGTAASPTDPFVSLQRLATTYDAYGRPTHQRFQTGVTTHSLQQTSYDTAGRPSCVTVRMNLTTFASPPVDACDPATAGTAGPDRITLFAYDAAGRTEYVTTAEGTTAEAVTRTLYTDNGKPLLVQQPVGGVLQRSTWEYDRFDRVAKLRYPLPGGGSSSTLDFDSVTYDAASNISTSQNRSGQVFTFTYDALNRVTDVDAPAGVADTTYAYDNLNRPLTATQALGTPHTITNSWDALSRLVSQTGRSGAMSYGYDLAGHRTQIMWPDGGYVTYAYNPYGDVTGINQATSTNLATYAYDDLGRRTSVTRSNGVVTAWNYDAAGRLFRLRHNLASTPSDTDTTFAYNPAGQITQTVANNDSYAWTGGVTGALAYDANALNQVMPDTGPAFAYDTRGNLTLGGGQTFAFNALNQLTGATGPTATMTYDPAGRLYSLAGGGANIRFQYDDLQAVAEYASNDTTLLRRHVPGPGVDEVLLTYEGTGTGDKRWLLADERGSTIALTNDLGVALNKNSYDEYGVPGSANAGRFQYTGQMWLPEVGIYHYKARAYEPDLGRFLQTDPIGYGAGMNLYAYVAGDPINAIDPLGLQTRVLITKKCHVSSVPGQAGLPDVRYCSTSYTTIDVGGSGRGNSGEGRGSGRGGGPRWYNPSLQTNPASPNCHMAQDIWNDPEVQEMVQSMINSLNRFSSRDQSMAFFDEPGFAVSRMRNGRIQARFIEGSSPTQAGAGWDYRFPGAIATIFIHFHRLYEQPSGNDITLTRNRSPIVTVTPGSGVFFSCWGR